MTTADTKGVCPNCGAASRDAATCPACGQATATQTFGSPLDDGSPPQGIPKEIGQQIGRFTLLARLGRGGFASVYRAEDATLNRDVAIKLLHPHLATDAGFVRRFNAEARAAARLRHPHIVPIHEVGAIADGRPYLVMALLDGRPLSKFIAEHGPLSVEQAAPILWQLASALDYVHVQGLVHRDVKPSNVMVDATGDVTLMDFGVARALNEQSLLTHADQLIGTPVYMAPEQISGPDVGAAADIYSLGILAFELLAGRPPFVGSVGTVIRDQLDAQPPPLSAFNPNVPEATSQAIALALMKEPANRPSSATEFVRLFTGEATPDSVQARILRTQPAARKPPTRDVPSRLVLGVGAVLTLLIALLAWLFLSGPLAGGDGRLIVSSEPPGASVTVDGRRLGVTPLAQQRVKPGTHMLVLEKPTYLTVVRQEKVASRRTDEVNAVLSSRPQSELLRVTNSGVTLSEGTQAFGLCRTGQQVSQVRVEQPFCVGMTVAPMYPGERDMTFRYEFALFDASGLPLQRGESITTTLRKGEAQRPITWTYTFPGGPSADYKPGSYQIKFSIDGNPVGSAPIELIP